MISPGGRWLQVNRSLREMLGYEETEFQSTTMLGLTHPEDAETLRLNSAEILRGEVASARLEVRFIDKDGRTVWTTLSISLVRNGIGSPLHFVSQHEDITSRKKAEDARLSESTVRSFYDSAPMMMGVIEPCGGDLLFVSANAATASFLGQTPDSICGQLASRLGIPRSIARSGPCDFEKPPRAPRRFGSNSSIGWGDTDASFPLSLHTSKRLPGPTLGSHSLSKISARKRVEAGHAAQLDAIRLLAESESIEAAGPRLLEAIGKHLDMEIGEFWQIDSASGMHRLSDSWTDRPGRYREFIERSRNYSFASGVGLAGDVWDAGSPIAIEDVTLDRRFVRTTLAARARIRGAIALPVKGRKGPIGVVIFLSRERLEIDDSLLGLSDLLGRQIGLFIERRRAEAEVTRVNSRLNSLLDAATQVAIIACDPDGIITLFNSGAERMFGYTRGELIDRQTIGLFHVQSELTEHAERLSEEYNTRILDFEAPVERARRGDHEVKEWTLLRKNRSKLTVSLAVTALRSVGHQLDGFLGIAIDVTARKRAEDKFRLLFEKSSDAYILLGENTEILDCNHATITMLGYTEKAQVLQLHASQLLPEYRLDGRPSNGMAMAPPYTTDRDVAPTHRFDCWQQRADGSSFPAEVSITIVEMDGRHVVMVVLHDLTERMATTEELRRAKRRPRPQARPKANFSRT